MTVRRCTPRLRTRHRRTRIRRPLIAAGALLVLTGCSEPEPDAYGHFEATEVVVSAEVGGRLVRFDAEAGRFTPAGSVVGQIDTTQLALQRAELRAQQAAGQRATARVVAERGVLEARLDAAEREAVRVRRLHDGGAATLRQLEQADDAAEVLRQQIRALDRQADQTTEESRVLDARLAQLDDRLERSRIESPITGTILTTYRNAGEFVQPGQPLFMIADLDTMILRAYVTGDQLATIRLGQSVTVRHDAAPGETTTLPGTLTWISASAEFTPTTIQTRDTRTDLVYAVEIQVGNPHGALKIGMPADVDFTAVGPAASTDEPEPAG